MPQTPLQTVKGNGQMHSKGMSGGNGMNPFLHPNKHKLLEEQLDSAWSGKEQDWWFAAVLTIAVRAATVASFPPTATAAIATPLELTKSGIPDKHKQTPKKPTGMVPAKGFGTSNNPFS
jgi:hypothetical protein